MSHLKSVKLYEISSESAFFKVPLTFSVTHNGKEICLQGFQKNNLFDTYSSIGKGNRAHIVIYYSAC